MEEQEFIKPRKIGKITKDEIPYITLPHGFGEIGQYVQISFISDDELKLTLIKGSIRRKDENLI